MGDIREGRGVKIKTELKTTHATGVFERNQQGLFMVSPRRVTPGCE